MDAHFHRREAEGQRKQIDGEIYVRVFGDPCSLISTAHGRKGISNK